MTAIQGALQELADFLREHHRAVLGLFLGWVLPLLLFVQIAVDVFEQRPFAFERPLMLALHAQGSPLLDRVAVTFSVLGSTSGMVPVVLLLLAGIYQVRPRSAYFTALSLGSVAIITVILKDLFGRPRPTLWEPILPEPDSSFPSGHAMFASALTATLVLLLWHTRWRLPVLLLGALYVLGMMWSRVYIGVHYPTDVIGGALFSVAWVSSLAGVVHLRRELKAEGDATARRPGGG